MSKLTKDRMAELEKSKDISWAGASISALPALLSLVPSEAQDKVSKDLKKFHDTAFSLGSLAVLRMIAGSIRAKKERAQEYPDNPLEGGVGITSTARPKVIEPEGPFSALDYNALREAISGGDL